MHFDLIVNPEYFMEKNLAKLIVYKIINYFA